MKKYNIIFLILFPYLFFAQSKEKIQKAIEKINIELVKGYVKNNEGSFPNNINDSKSLYEYIKKTYPKKGHIVHSTYLNLIFLKNNCKEEKKPRKFIDSVVNEYVKYPYDKSVLNGIINTLPKENKLVSSNNEESKVQEKHNEAQKDTISNQGEIIPPIEIEIDDDKIPVIPEVDLYHVIVPYWIFMLFGLIIGYLMRPSISWLFSKLKFNMNDHTENEISGNNRQDQGLLGQNEIVDDETIDTHEKYKNTESVNVRNGWMIAHTSEIGKSHVFSKPPIPCQDNHAIKKINKHWGIAVSCDGAGSAKLSHEGSKFIADEALTLFEEILTENDWVLKNELPSSTDWNMLSRKAMKKLRYDLEQFAKHKTINVNELACTIIVVIYSPIGLLTTHIGDGRAGYRDSKDIWKSIISPHKGEEANQTIFITSNPWLQDDFKMSGVSVPESNVVKDAPTAFTLMSDGCETHSFELGYFDKEAQKFIEQNIPYTSFFEPLLETLLKMKKDGLSTEEINSKWSLFIKEGTEKLKNEPDDKTLILGILTN